MKIKPYGILLRSTGAGDGRYQEPHGRTKGENNGFGEKGKSGERNRNATTEGT